MIEQSTEKELVERFLNGDTACFEAIIRRYQKQIYWHARRMVGSHLDADDIVQEVYLVLYKKLKEFRFNSSLSTWIYTITARKSINFLQRNRLRKWLSLDDAAHEPELNPQDISLSMDDRAKLKEIDAALLQLPAKQREVFVLRNFDELSYEEISEITGTSVGALKANYFHALKKVTELVKR